MNAETSLARGSDSRKPVKHDARQAAIVASNTQPRVHRGIAGLLFIVPITGVMAGAISIEGFTPHVFTSALLGLIGVAAILRPHRKVSRRALTVALLALSWLIVVVLHVGLLDATITNEVTISLSGFAILLGVAAVRVSHRTFDAVVVGWTAAYFLAAVVAVMEKYFGFVPQNSFLVQRGYALETVGLSSLFGNPNGFGLFLLASSIMFLPYAVSAQRPFVRLFYYALQLSTLYFMIESGSRTGLTCLLVVMICTLWQLLYKHDLARMLLILVVIALFVAQALTPSGTEFINGLRQSSVFTSDDGSFLLRFNLVRNGLVFASENPLIGIGPDQYEVHMLTSQDLYPTSFIINPHNGFIEILSQYGIFVFSIFILLLIQTGVSAWKLMRSATSKRDRNYLLGQAQLLLIILLPFASTMHSTFLGAPSAWLYLCALIALGRMASIQDEQSQTMDLSGSGAVPRSPGARRTHG